MSNAPDESSRREGRSPVWAIGLLFGFYFLTRVSSLDVLPIFLDEAVHIQWAERLYNEGRILRPVGSGRLLAVAAYGVALPFDDRLWVARLAAAMVGAVTLAFVVLLARRLFNERTGLIAGCLYVTSPFALVYDRLALSDAFLSASIAGLLLSTWTLIQKPDTIRPRAMVAIGVALAVVAKVSALLFFLTLPVGVLALARDKPRALRSMAIALLGGLLCAAPMLWFFVSNSGEVSAQHLMDPQAAGAIISSTLVDMRDWLRSYYTIPSLLIAGASLAFLRDGRALWLGGSVFVPFLLFALFSQPWSARYVLPTLPPFLVLLAGGIENVASRVKASRRAYTLLGLLMLASVFTLSFDRGLLFDPANAPFPRDDRLQLVTGWPSGYGVRELAFRLREEAKDGPLTAFVDTGGTRTVSTDLAVLLGRDSSIRLVEGDLGLAEFRASVVPEIESDRVFAVLGPRTLDLDLTPLFQGAAVERVAIYRRPGGEWAVSLFRLRPRAPTENPGSR